MRFQLCHISRVFSKCCSCCFCCKLLVFPPGRSNHQTARIVREPQHFDVQIVRGPKEATGHRLGAPQQSPGPVPGRTHHVSDPAFRFVTWRFHFELCKNFPTRNHLEDGWLVGNTWRLRKKRSPSRVNDACQSITFTVASCCKPSSRGCEQWRCTFMILCCYSCGFASPCSFRFPPRILRTFPAHNGKLLLQTSLGSRLAGTKSFTSEPVDWSGLVLSWAITTGNSTVEYFTVTRTPCAMKPERLLTLRNTFCSDSFEPFTLPVRPTMVLEWKSSWWKSLCTFTRFLMSLSKMRLDISDEYVRITILSEFNGQQKESSVRGTFKNKLSWLWDENKSNETNRRGPITFAT